MKGFLSKLKSRKLWAALIGLTAGLAVIFGVDESVINTVSGAVVSAVSVVAYIITEGRIDAAAIGQSASQLHDALSSITKKEDA